MNDVGTLLVHYGIDMNDMDKAEASMKSSMSRVGSHALSIGKMIAGAAGLGSLVYVGANVAKSFMAFEDAMQKVKVVSGATEEEFTKLTELAREMGKTTEFSADQVANAMYELSSAGLSAADQMSVLPSVLDLATAGNLELGDAAETVMKTLSGFGMAGTEAGKVTDVLSMAVNKSMLHFEDLALSMKYIAPIAGATNQSLEDMIAALGIMSDAGIKGEQAGTSMRQALIRLVDPTKEVKEGLESIGLTQADLDPTTHRLSEIIGTLAERTDGLTDSQKNQALAQIFGTESLSAMLAIVNKGPAALNSFSSSLNNASGSAKSAAEQMRESTGKQLEILKNKLMDVGYSVVEAVLPSIEKFINKIMELADSGKLEEWGAVLGDILSEAVDLFGKILGVVDWVIDKFGGLENAIYGVAAAYTVLKLSQWAGGVSTAGAAATQAAGGMSGAGGAAGAAAGGLIAQAKDFGLEAAFNATTGGMSALAATAVPTSLAIAGIGTAAVAAGIAIKTMADNLAEAKKNALEAEANANQALGDFRMESAEEAALAYQNLKGTLDETSLAYRDYKARMMEAGMSEAAAGQAAALAASGRKEAAWAINAEIQALNSHLNTLKEGSQEYEDTKQRMKDLSSLLVEVDKKAILSAEHVNAAVREAVGNMSGVPDAVKNALASSDEEFYQAGVNGMADYTEGILLMIGASAEAAAELAQTVREALSSEDPEIRKNAAKAVEDMLNEMASKEQISYSQAKEIADSINSGLTITTDPSINIGTIINRILTTLHDKKGSIDDAVREINDALNNLGVTNNPDVAPGTVGNYTTFGTGGIVTSRTFAQVGEDGIETILPLNNPARSLALMSKSLEIMGISGGPRSYSGAPAISGGDTVANETHIHVHVGNLIGDDRSLETLMRKLKFEIEPLINRPLGGRK